MITISKNIKLKPITFEDQEKLYTLIQRIYPPSYKHLWKNEDCSWYLNKFYTPEPFKKELSETNSDYHFVLYNKQTVGVIRVVYNKTFPDKPGTSATYLNRIYLGEEAQGKGVAKQLMLWIEQRTLENGNSLLWLKAMDTQKQALKFYKKEGFIISSTTSLDFELLLEPLRGMYRMFKNLQ